MDECIISLDGKIILLNEKKDYNKRKHWLHLDTKKASKRWWKKIEEIWRWGFSVMASKGSRNQGKEIPFSLDWPISSNESLQ